MTVNSKAMAGVPVRTRSGELLGKVGSFEFEAETGRLTAIRVRSRNLLKEVLEDDLFVSWDQVLEVTLEAVIVADATVLAAATGVVPSLA
jgi:sporulation protein YlmC with PRC-barrel domain